MWATRRPPLGFLTTTASSCGLAHANPAHRHLDSLRSRLHGYFAMDGFDLSGVTDAAVASVVPVLTRAWLRCFQRMLKHDPLLIGPGATCGIELALRNPSRVGADRIANAVAAVKTYGAPVIVVDFGTATNIDVVDQNGAYRGGTIGPGLILSADALFARAAKAVERPHRGTVARIGRLNGNRPAIRPCNRSSRAGGRLGGTHKKRVGNRRRHSRRHRWSCTDRQRCHGPV